MNAPTLRLEPMTEEDGRLRVRMETDDEVMRHLGGARPEADILRAHRSSLEEWRRGECWPLKVIRDGEAEPVAMVTIFPSEHDGERFYEIGWMTVPELQGRGIASEAVRMVLERARREQRFGVLHAYPPVTNPASNRLCEKHGFTLLGECDVEFSGRLLRCNHWRLALD